MLRTTLSYFFLVAACSTVNANEIDLTGDIWDIEGVDDYGTTWNDSTLLFTSQTGNGANFDLIGYFDWIGSKGTLGRENFTGTFFDDNTINLTGNSLEAIPGVGGPNGIVTANYSILLDASGNRMVGDWSGGSVVEGDFTATRVPEPATLTLLGFAGMMLGFGYQRLR